MYVRGHEYLLGPSPWVSSEKGPAFLLFLFKETEHAKVERKCMVLKTPFASIVLELLTDNIMWFLIVGSKIGLMFQSHMIFYACH